jgi:sulfatase modifying factor 1
MVKRLGGNISVFVCAVLLAGCTRQAPPSRTIESWTEPVTGMRFLAVPAGSFRMGSPSGEPMREAQESAHEVTLTRPFWLGAFEVTQREWRAVMNTAPSWFKDDERRPVENVNWHEVQKFLRELAAKSPGYRFRLPTEAEWEYACRAGTTTAYSTGPSLGEDAANVARSPDSAAAGEGSTRPVGTYAANPWGFFDMHGNVWEWTADEHCPYAESEATDPAPSCGSELKVIRGGSFYFGADSARCALRYTHRPIDRGFSIGFRVVREDQP